MHVKSDVREALQSWIESEATTESSRRFRSESFEDEHGSSWTVTRLLADLQHCTDQLPRWHADALDLPSTSRCTYAAAVRDLRRFRTGC